MDPRACLLRALPRRIALRPPCGRRTRVPRGLGDHPFLDLCRVWNVPPGDPPRMIRAKVPTLVLAGQMDPDISQPVLDEAITALDPGFLVTSMASARTYCAENAAVRFKRLGLKTPCSHLTPAARRASRSGLHRPHRAWGWGRSPIPEGTYRVEITTADGVAAGSRRAHLLHGVLGLTLDQGRFRLHWTDSPKQDQVGGTGGRARSHIRRGRAVRLRRSVWTVRWRARNRGIVLAATEMRSREDARFFASPTYLAVIGLDAVAPLAASRRVALANRRRSTRETSCVLHACL